ncbi:9-O-acetylesterase [bacterium]|nr:9-O-acetylesterase [bacterium]
MKSLISASVHTAVVAVLLLCAGCRGNNPDRLSPAAHIRLPKIFGNHMVLQHDHDIAVWGKADPGGCVTVVLNGHTAHAKVSKDSTWHLKLPPVDAGGPYVMQILGSDTLLFSDILAGEVWICSGQSNMEWPLIETVNSEREIARADYPGMRIFTVMRNTALHPVDTLSTYGWMPVNPANIPYFSAVGYLFGRDIHKHLHVPVGLIHISWGGTPVEAWTSLQTMEKQKEFEEIIRMLKDKEKVKADSAVINPFSSLEEQVRSWQAWITDMDAGLADSADTWIDPQAETEDWPVMDIPGPRESGGLPGYDGVVWFRKEVEIGGPDTEKSWTLCLGPLDDIDFTYLNGQLLGSETVYNTVRRYRIPKGQLKPGVNILVVRILDFSGVGGFWGAPDDVKLVSSRGDSISLAGEWRFKPGVELKMTSGYLSTPRHVQQLPTVLFNGMVAPVIPYTMRGVIWYQGEDNASRAYQYRRLFPAMIRDWRTRWAQGDFPFLFVQLANYMTAASKPGDSDWAELREAQCMALSEPNTGMAVAIDIGEAEHIHPGNKREVGRRLALIARARVYGEDVVYSGPLLQGMRKEDGQIRLTFQHTGTGLIAKGGELKGFAIAGADRKFVWADARIEGNTVVVFNPGIPDPVSVRYGWANNPACSLYNREGLPASPFRTDNWPGITKDVVF